MLIGSNYTLYAKFFSKEKGYGVFSNDFIPVGSIVETCYCIPVSTFEWEDYSFGDPRVLPLGFGAIYNHSDNPNIDWGKIDDFIIGFTSLTDIEPGDEICHNYGKSYWEDRKEKRLI